MHFSLARLLLALAVLGSVPAMAQTRPSSQQATGRALASGPKRIGRWEDWEAATHQEGGQAVCYAFTRASASNPAARGRSVLTVTQRPGGRDTVALSAGFTYAPNAEAQLTAEGVTLPLYTSRQSAFARDGKAAVALFAKARQVVLRSPGPRGAAVTDTFSLRGFSQAYAATTKACPAR
jgi:hypothetical protein